MLVACKLLFLFFGRRCNCLAAVPWIKLFLTFSAGARIEEFLYEKLDRKAPSRITNGELLGQYMQDAAKEFGPGTPYG